jgi:hypothetical protein
VNCPEHLKFELNALLVLLSDHVQSQTSAMVGLKRPKNLLVAALTSMHNFPVH